MSNTTSTHAHTTGIHAAPTGDPGAWHRVKVAAGGHKHDADMHSQRLAGVRRLHRRVVCCGHQRSKVRECMRRDKWQQRTERERETGRQRDTHTGEGVTGTTGGHFRSPSDIHFSGESLFCVRLSLGCAVCETQLRNTTDSPKGGNGFDNGPLMTPKSLFFDAYKAQTRGNTVRQI